LSNKNNILDSVLRQAAEDMHIPNVDASWGAIESGVLKAQRRRKLFAWFTAAALVILIGTFGIVQFISNDKTDVQNSNDESANIESVVKPEQSDESIVTIDDSEDEANEPIIDSHPRLDSDKTEVKGFDGSIGQKDFSNKNSNNTHIKSIEESNIKGTDDNIDKILPISHIDDNEIEIEEGNIDVNPAEMPVQDGPEVIVADENENAVDSATKVVSGNSTINISTESTPRDESSSKFLDGNWELGLSVSPGVAAQLSKASKNFAWLINDKYFDNTQSEKISSSYQVDLSANYHFNDKMYLGTGLRYVNRSESVSYDYTIDRLVTVRESEQRLVYAPLAPALHQKVKYDGINSYNFVDVPIRLGILYPLGNKWSWRSELNVNYSYLLNASGSKVDGTHLSLKSISDLDINRSNIGMAGLIGMERKFGERLSGSLNAMYNTNLTSWRAKEKGLIERPYNYGITFGLNYKLTGNN